MNYYAAGLWAIVVFGLIIGIAKFVDHLPPPVEYDDSWDEEDYFVEEPDDTDTKA